MKVNSVTITKKVRRGLHSNMAILKSFGNTVRRKATFNAPKPKVRTNPIHTHQIVYYYRYPSFTIES